MKALLFISLLLFIILFSGCKGQQGEEGTSTTIIITSFNQPDDIYNCQTNDDCVLLEGNIEQVSCCSYSAVNEKYKRWYKEKIEESIRGCERIGCGVSLYVPRAVCYEMQCRVSNVLVIEGQEYGDYCEKNDDCVVRDVHNCCGYYPGCVNKDYYPDVEAVRRECQERGLASICGFSEIDECKCVENTCKSF